MPTPQIQLTDAAVRAAQDGLGTGESLRVVFAGGCGAFAYRIATARRAYPGDEVGWSQDGLEVYLDQRAVRELRGAILDFDSEDGFVIDHPLAGPVC